MPESMSSYRMSLLYTIIRSRCYNFVMKLGVDYIAVTTAFYCVDGKGKLLLHKRSKNCRDEQGTWDPGGGLLEFGLTLEENTTKEIAEEYGCKGEIVEQVSAHTVLRTFNGVKTHWVAIPFFVLIDPKKLKNNSPDKIDEMGWFTLGDLPKPLHSGFNYSFNRYKDLFLKYVRN